MWDFIGEIDRAANLRVLQEEIIYDLRELEFSAVRRSVRTIFLQVEQGVLGWGDHAAIKELRNLELARALRERPTTTQGAAGEKDNKPILVCFPYQRNECSVKGQSHQSTRGLLYHVCQYCLTTTGNKFYHPESDCRRKKSASEKPTKEADTKEE